jgi:GNAT superfamily N-acetyltransferase
MNDSTGHDVQIREANVDDSALILRFVQELADYEKSGDQVTATVESLASTLFGTDSRVTTLIATIDGTPAGFAMYFYNISTWQGKKGLYLEDLYVTPQYRHAGVGKRLLQRLASIAVENGCGRFEWMVLDWNQPAIDFYQSIGAKPMSEWVKYRMDGQALADFAGARS